MERVQENNECRLYGDRAKNVSHIINECMLAP